MKIAVPASAPNLEAQVEHKPGTATYLLVIDTKDMTFESIERPPTSHGPGAGIEALTLVLDRGADVILTGYISPNIAGPIRRKGIEVITSVSGSVREAVEKYNRGAFDRAEDSGRKISISGSRRQSSEWSEALKKTARQYLNILPVLSGVIFLVGLFRSLLPTDFLLGIFSGNMLQDTFIGALVGSLLAGNPINSYVIGETLLEIGVGPHGVAAMMLTWVSVWLVQLPVEISVLGARFAVIRNVIAFVVAIPASFLIVWLSGGTL